MTFRQVALSTVFVGMLGSGCASTVLRADGSGGDSSSSQASTTQASSTIASTGTGAPLCDTSAECAKDFVCIHADGLCGKGVKGTCQADVHPPCPLLPRVCRCDGTVVTICGTVDASKDASLCSKGTFPCGNTQCKDYIEYCTPNGCVKPPPTCELGIAECNCIKEPGSCQDDGDGAVHFFPAVP